MKKFLTLITLLMAFAAPSLADFYLLENNSGTWKPGADGKQAMELLPGTTDTYYMDVNPGNDGKWYFIADGDGESEADFKANHRYAFSSEMNFTNGIDEWQELSIQASNNFVINNGYPSPKVTYRFLVKDNGGSLSLKVIKGLCYVVAGCFEVDGNQQASFFGTTWNTEKEENRMKMQLDETYAITYQGVVFESAGTIKYKITKNYSWDGAVPSGDNAWASIPAAGTYDITFTFDGSNYTCKVKPITDIYTVAGEPTSFFGGENAWNPTLSSNDMTKSDGIFTWKKENVELDGNTTIKFKVCANHAWDFAYPNQNYEVKPAAGKYNVTITFNESTEEVTALFEEVIATIESVAITPFGQSAIDLTDYGVNNVYEKDNIDLSSVPTDIPFQLTVNGTNLSFDDLTIDPASAALLEKGSDTFDGYIVFKHSTSGYATYTATATWTPGSDASKGWTLKIVGKELLGDAYIHGEMFGGWENGQLMTKQANGLYTYVLENFSATASAYQYRMNTHEGNDFSGYTLPTTNLVWNPAKPAIYNLTFKANVSGQEIDGVAANTLELTAEMIPFTGYYLVGGTGAWTVSSTPIPGESGVYSTAIPYTSGYSFALVPNTVVDANGVIEGGWWAAVRPESQTAISDFVTITGSGSTTDNGQNWKMGEAANYDNIYFDYDSNDNKWTITCSETITISDAKYATYSNSKPFQVQSGVEVDIVTTAAGSANFTKLADNPILAGGVGKGTGVILQGSGNVVINSVADGATYVSTEGNLMAGSGDVDGYEIIGRFSDTDFYTPYILMKGEQGVGFYMLDVTNSTPAERTLAAHKAFLAAPTGSTAPFLAIGGEATGIQNIERTLNDGLFYDLSGRRVENPTKGLYIINGKKVIVK